MVFSIEDHMERYHQDKVPNFSCCKCGDNFNRKDSLERHKGRIHGVRSIDFLVASQSLRVNSGEWKCKMCNTIFDSVVKLEDHLAKRICSDCDVHICEYCQKSYKEKHNLLVHIKNKHLKEESFKCNKCGKQYQQKKSLTRHAKYCLMLD